MSSINGMRSVRRHEKKIPGIPDAPIAPVQKTQKQTLSRRVSLLNACMLTLQVHPLDRLR